VFLVNQFLPDHPNLGNRAAPCHRAKAQETQKQTSIRLARWRGF
jgi:hypothetical protein